MHRISCAQVGLEYLLSYAWALVIITVVVGVLVFIASMPAQDVIFSITEPTKFLLKGGVVSGSTALIKVQNITGGSITIQKVTLSSGYNDCYLNQVKIDSNKETSIWVPAGGEILIECGNVTHGTGEILLEYEDFAGMKRKMSIKASGRETGQPAENCSNGIDDDDDNKVDCADSNCVGAPNCRDHEGSGYFGTCCDGIDNDSDGAEDGVDTDCSGDFSLSEGYNPVCWGSDWDPFSFSGWYWSGAYYCPAGEVVSNVDYEIHLNTCAPDFAQCSYFHLMNSDGGWLDFTNSCSAPDSEDYGYCSGPVSSKLLQPSNSVRFSFNTADCGCEPAKGVRVHGVTCATTQCSGNEQRGCLLQQGVCAGAKETCTGGEWPGCNATTYETNNPQYEETEASCADLQDNDCDNKFDCDDTDCKNEAACSEIWCATNDSHFPVKGGITIPEYHQTQLRGNCRSMVITDNAIFLRNHSGQTLSIYNTSISIGTSAHFDKYWDTGSCGFRGYFYSEACPEQEAEEGTEWECVGIISPQNPFKQTGGYCEGFSIPTINDVYGAGEACAPLQNITVGDGNEIRIGTGEFYICADRGGCESPTDEIWRTHKSNPITISLNTSAGPINVYCYNFPVPGSGPGPAQCTDGQQRDCPLQQGVCAGAKETCTNGAWPGCTAATYGSSYEETETSCADLQDNDCDNEFDCDDSDCKARPVCSSLWCTTHNLKFPVKGGISRSMEVTWGLDIEGVIEIQSASDAYPELHFQQTLPNALQLQPNEYCTNWTMGDNMIYLLNHSGQTLDIYNASVSLGPSHFNDYTADSCAFRGRFSSDRCPDSNSGETGGFSEYFWVTSVNGKPGASPTCNINTSIPAGEEIRVGISDFSYCPNRDPYLPQDCNYPSDLMLCEHKDNPDNPITISLTTSAGTIDIDCYNFPFRCSQAPEQ